MSDEERPVPADAARQDAEVRPVPTAEELSGLLEALLLMSEEPADETMLAEAAGAPVGIVREALDGLVRHYDEGGHGFELRRVGGGWRYHTRPEHHDRIAAWVRAGGRNRLSQAAMETLAVIAYLQPVPRSRVSAVRGVNVDGVGRTLLARALVDEQGADASTGAGLLVTTDHFLARLGLDSLSGLPDIAPLLPDASALEAELSRLARPAEDADAEAQDADETAGRRADEDEGQEHDEPDQRP